MLDFLRRVVSLCRKELLAILKDPANRIILVVPSLMESFLFGYAATYDLNNVPYALLDQSRGAASAELVARLDGTGVFRRVATLETPSDIARVIDSGEALMVIQIGPRFERQLNAGEPAPVQLILDGRNSNTAGSAAFYVGTVIEAYNTTLRVGEQASAYGRVARLVQPQPRNALEPAARPDRLAQHDTDPDAGCAVRRTRARKRHLRPVAGDAIFANGNHDWQGHPHHAHRPDAVHHRPAGGAVLVQDTAGRLAR